jgi:hypothetical protein
MTWLLVVAAAYVLFHLAILAFAVAAVIQLARLQRAIAKHRASAGTWDDDDALYATAGFDPAAPLSRQHDPRFLRGKGQRG